MTLKIGQYLSGNLLQSSIYLCKLAKEIETERQEDSENYGQKKKDYSAYVIGSILLTGAFLDSAINELLFNMMEVENPSNPLQEQIIDKHFNILKNLDKILGKITEYKFEKKCDIILAFFERGRFSGILGNQDVSNFLIIRNRTTHYEFVWEDRLNTDYDVAKKYLELKKYVKSKFPINCFADPSDLFFPNQCLGYGCASWGIKISVSFMEEFYKTIDIEYPVTLLKYMDLNNI